jgi:methionyl-tRNA synthetase
MTIDKFNESDLRIGKIVSVEPVKGSGKLLKFTVDIGETAPRQILSGVAKVYRPKDLIGRRVIVLANLVTKTMVGEESQGMLLGIEHGEDGNPLLIFPENDIPTGAKIS